MADDPLGLAQLPKVKVPAVSTPRPEALLVLATGVVVVSALYLARDVLIPITLAIFLSFFLAPIVKLLQRARLPKVAAVIVAVVVALAVILLVGAIIGSQTQGARRELAAISVDGERQDRAGFTRPSTTLVTQVTSRLGTLHELPTPASGSLGEAAPGQPPIPVVVETSSSGYLESGAPDSGANSLAPGHARHRSHRHDIHPRPAGGSSRSADTAIWLQRSSSNHPRHRRRNATPDQVFSHPGRDQRKLRLVYRRRSVFHRPAEPGALGPSRRALAIYSLCRIDNRRRASHRAGRRRRSGLVNCALDGRAFHRRRGRDRPIPGAGARTAAAPACRRPRSSSSPSSGAGSGDRSA